jgi:hypothetical protein
MLNPQVYPVLKGRSHFKIDLTILIEPAYWIGLWLSKEDRLLETVLLEQSQNYMPQMIYQGIHLLKSFGLVHHRTADSGLH